MNTEQSKTRKRAELALEALHGELVEEIRKLRTGGDWKLWLRTASVFHQYSFRNAVLIAAQLPSATMVANATIWGRLGRQVVKGESIRIFAPIFARSSKGADETGEPRRRTDHELGDDSETSKSRPGRRLVGFRVAHVWDVSKTTGEPLPNPPEPERLVGPAPSGLWEGLATCVEGEGFKLVVGPTGRSGRDGFTDFEARQIVVSDSLSEASAISTLAHEVAHMLMHDPDAVAASGSVMCRGMREVEAESVAFMLLAHHGLETDGETFLYVAGWAASVDSAEPERVVQRTGERVLRTARDLIELTSQREPPDRRGPVRHLGLVPASDTPTPEGPAI